MQCTILKTNLLDMIFLFRGCNLWDSIISLTACINLEILYYTNIQIINLSKMLINYFNKIIFLVKTHFMFL